MFFIGFSAIGFEMTLLGGVLFGVIISILLVVNITPANLGVRELLVGIISSATGQSFEAGVLVSTIIRASAGIVHIVIGIPGLLIMKKSRIFKN